MRCGPHAIGARRAHTARAARARAGRPALHPADDGGRGGVHDVLGRGARHDRTPRARRGPAALVARFGGMHVAFGLLVARGHGGWAGAAAAGGAPGAGGHAVARREGRARDRRRARARCAAAPPHAARHGERAGRRRVARLQRPQDAAADLRRQPERARAQARGRRLRHVHEDLRESPAPHRLPPDRTGAAGPGPLPGPPGGHHPRRKGHARALSPALFFFRGDFMTQSALEDQAGLHVAVIMDGNGRWATARGLPRTAGHARGAAAVRRTVEAAPALGIRMLSLYAFSSDNWRRPPAEVRALLRLFARYLRAEAPALAARGVRLSVIGCRDRLPPPLAAAITRAERRTAAGRALDLRIAIDYSARDAIVRAAARLSPG